VVVDVMTGDANGVGGGRRCYATGVFDVLGARIKVTWLLAILRMFTVCHL